MALLAVSEAARELGIARSTLYRYIKSGKVLEHKEDGNILVDTNDIVNFLNRKKSEQSMKKNGSDSSAADAAEIEKLTRNCGQLKAAHEEAIQKINHYERQVSGLKHQLAMAQNQLKLQQEDIFVGWMDVKLTKLNHFFERIFAVTTPYVKENGRNITLILFLLSTFSWLVSWSGLAQLFFSLGAFAVFIYMMYAAVEQVQMRYQQAIQKHSIK